jgi:(S)-mandelate dehydrogenase
MARPDRFSSLTIPEIREKARRRLPRGLFEFIDRGTEDETALSNNAAAFSRLRLRPRVLVDVSRRSTETTLFDRGLSLPLAIAPTGAAGLVHHRGETVLARAAHRAGIPFTLATRSMSSIEDISAATEGEFWFQLYPSSPAAFDLMDRAQTAGCRVLVVTVDTPVTPLRRYNARNGFALPFRASRRAMIDMALHPVWCAGVLGRSLIDGGLPRFENLPGRPRITEGAPASDMLEGRLDWERLAMLRDRWPGRLVVKGILHPDDALRSAEIGADAIVVSNHGGRNLDTSVAPLDALPEVVRATGDRLEVLVDGAVRSGSDIVKALALGASAVMIGRPVLFGLAADGEAGVARVIDVLAGELDYTLAMSGCPSIADVGNDLIVR